MVQRCLAKVRKQLSYLLDIDFDTRSSSNISDKFNHISKNVVGFSFYVFIIKYLIIQGINETMSKI